MAKFLTQQVTTREHGGNSPLVGAISTTDACNVEVEAIRIQQTVVAYSTTRFEFMDRIFPTARSDLDRSQIQSLCLLWQIKAAQRPGQDIRSSAGRLGGRCIQSKNELKLSVTLHI